MDLFVFLHDVLQYCYRSQLEEEIIITSATEGVLHIEYSIQITAGQRSQWRLV